MFESEFATRSKLLFLASDLIIMMTSLSYVAQTDIKLRLRTRQFVAMFLFKMLT